MPPGVQPPSKTRFEMILGMKEHEMHHRGQLMLVERMIGIVSHLTRHAGADVAGSIRCRTTCLTLLLLLLLSSGDVGFHRRQPLSRSAQVSFRCWRRVGGPYAD